MEGHFSDVGGGKMSRLKWTVTCLGLLLMGCHTTILVATSLGESKPRLQYYEKSGWTPETRRQDAAECGASGDSSDHAGIGSARIKAAQLPGETDRQTEMRLREAWHACMVQKGYRDIRAVTR
jgi:hypothetical protein